MPDTPTPYRIAVGAGAVVIAVAAGMWWGSRPPAPVPIVVDSVASSAAAIITVHVSGAVAAPGLVDLDPGARVADAVAAAGGALADADLGLVNLAADIGDGEQVEIPRRGAEAAPSGVGAAAAGVDLNRAESEELQELPGVGPVLAGRIIEHRDEHGPFASVEDLLDIPGIGEAKLNQMRAPIARP